MHWWNEVKIPILPQEEDEENECILEYVFLDLGMYDELIKGR